MSFFFKKFPTTTHFGTAFRITQLLLVCVWIFTAPTNLFWKILPNFGFVSGLQIDYLIPKLYLSDIVGLAIVGTWFWQVWQEKVLGRKFKNFQLTKAVLSKISLLLIPYNLLFTTCCSLFIVYQFFTPLPITAFWFLASLLLHGTTLLVVMSWVHQNRSLFFQKMLISVLTLTIVFQATLGMYQFVQQRQLVGFLLWGEPQLTRDLGLSKGNFASMDQVTGSHLGLRILPYGTTPHPNVLAGFLAIGILILLRFMLKISMNPLEKVLIGLGIGIGAMTLALTLSLSALLTLLIGILMIGYDSQFKFLKIKNITLNKQFINVWQKKSKLILLGILILTPFGLHGLNTLTHHNAPSLFRRDFLNQAAVKLFIKQPVFGVGLNQFTVAIAKGPQNQKETVSFVQPAHYITLLFPTENGLLGIGILFLLYRSLCKTFPSSLSVLGKHVWVILPIICLDHYFYTLTVGHSIFALGLFFLFL
ncbi:MAG: hypothetical protein ABI425_03580 [Patescibacteria group bacterium]